MLIYFGADHRGFELKEQLKNYVNDLGYEIYDAGNDRYDEGDDYTEFAAAVGQGVGRDPEGSKGVLVCGS
ncbi:MAG: RpiB/LacA/LacB family sugar-phosphate isomerase, partial [Anaplasmataceae bacterium]|nr:RpiB/LacA/LacB family sugar-phosphate isomerase [Anaplasmataceae bacterium]